MTKQEVQTALGLAAVVFIALLAIGCGTDSPTAPTEAAPPPVTIADADALAAASSGAMPDIRNTQPGAEHSIAILLRDATPYGYWRKQRIDARVTAGVRLDGGVLRVRLGAVRQSARSHRRPVNPGFVQGVELSPSASRAGDSRARG